MTALVTTRARRALVVAAALVATSCGGGSDEAAPPTTEVPATTAPAATTVPLDEPDEAADPDAAPRLLVASSSSANGDVSLTVESSEAEIWATTDRDDICSPAEPAVAVLAATLDGDRADDIDRLVAFFERAEDDDEGDTEGTTTTSTTSPTMPDGPSVEFAPGDDGTWTALVGPIEARNRNDRPMTVRVAAYGGRTAVVAAELGLTVLAPVQCDDGETSRRRLPDPVDLDVSTRPADGVIVGREVDDCAGRPTRLAVTVEASGAVVAMTATGTTPDGSSVVKSLEGRGGRTFTVTLGPFGSPPLGDTASLWFTVAATDVYGTTATDTVTATLVRPEPCDEPADTTVPTDTTELGDQPSASFAPDPIEIDAAAAGTCPTRPTTIAVTIDGAPNATSVTATARTANGTTVDTSLTWSNGAWRGTLGPIAGAATMPASSSLDVRISVVLDGQTRTFDRSGLLRRPAACAATTTPPTTTATTTTVPVTTTTTVPVTTTTTTTAAPTTTSTTAPPPQLTNAIANPNPVVCGDDFRIGAQTSGTVDRVIANYGGGQTTLNRNGNNWQSSQLSVPNPGTYSISVTAGNTATGQTDSTTFQLQVTDTGSC